MNRLQLTESELLPRDKMLLDFALGKAYLDLKDSQNAFAHLHAANVEKRKTFTYDPQQTEDLVERIISGFSADLYRLDSSTPAVENEIIPVFVVGMPRSGTSLIEQILASHSAVHGAGELTDLQKIFNSIGDFPEAFLRLAPEQFSAIGQTYRQRITTLAEGARFVVDKMPANFFYAGAMPLLLPNAKIIHCRRDPVDTCLSCYSKNFAGEQRFSYDLRELGAFYQSYSRLMEHWRQLLPASHFLEVEYEAVVADQERETRRILQYLGLEWEDGCERFYETPRAVRTASVNQVRSPIYHSSVGRWKRHAAELTPLLEVLGISAAS